MITHRYALALLAGWTLTAAAPAAEVRGAVTRVDLDKKELTLDAHGAGLGLRGTIMVFTLSDQTQVTSGDQPAALSDLAEGRRVRVQYETADGRQVAQAIHVLNGPKPAAPAAAAPPATIIPANADAVTGVLRHIAHSDREVVVVGPGAKGPETETTVAVPEAARIVKNGKDATFDDLKEGDAATVQVEKKDGRSSAVAIQVGPGAAAAKPAAKPASDTIPKIRLILKIADTILQGMEKKDRDKEP